MARDLKEAIRKQRQFAEQLLAEAKTYYEETGPVEVPTMFGETPATVLLPFIPPREFEELAERFPPRPGNAVDAPVWFNLHLTASNYPGVVLVMDGEHDDLRRIKGDSIHYIWPDLFDEMPPEDQQNFHMAVWSMHVWEPKQRAEAIRKRVQEDDNSLKQEGFTDGEILEALIDTIDEGDSNA